MSKSLIKLIYFYFIPEDKKFMFLFLLILTIVTGECVDITNNTHNLGEYQQFVTYDYSYPDNEFVLAARQTLAGQRVKDKYLYQMFVPSYIAATLYPKCNRKTDEIYAEVCLLDKKYAYCCVYFAPGYDFALQLPRCTPLVYNGKGLYSLYAKASNLLVSFVTLLLLATIF